MAVERILIDFYMFILTGKGWYRYEKPGGKEAFVDPEVEQIILQYSRDNGLERRNIPSQVGVQT